jgi:hypothetical protein
VRDVVAPTRNDMTDRRVYKVIFHNRGDVYEVYARSVSQGALFGFVEIEDLVFGQRSSVVVDPSEETLKNEFKGVKRFYVPLHAVVRIDQVEKEGAGRITRRAKGEGAVTAFPTPVYDKPGGDPGTR